MPYRPPLFRLLLALIIFLLLATPLLAQTTGLNSAGPSPSRLPLLLKPGQTPPPLRPVTTYPLPDPAWRIPITRDGLYRLSYQTLLQAGVPITTAAPASYHLSWMGRPVAMYEQGLADGTFDPGDALLFYGRKFHGTEEEQKYSDEGIYWLTLDATTPGLRLRQRDVTPDPSGTPVSATLASLLIEQNNLYWARWSNHPGTSATWFWERAIATTRPVTRTYPFSLSGLITSTTASATLRLEVAARSTNPATNPDHHLRWLLNGAPLGEDTFEGKVGAIFTHTLPASLLQPGANHLQMELLPDVGIQDIYFDRALLIYPHRLFAQNDRLFFGASILGTATYTLTGFTGTPSFLLEITDPLQPVLLTHAGFDASHGTLAFSDSRPVGAVYAAFAAAQPLTPTLYHPPTDILTSTTGADEIIIVPAAFYTATLPLADRRRQEGLRVQIVAVEHLYVLFNGGHFHPRAIRDFLTYAYGHWPGPPPAYVLLVGDGHFNFKGYNPAVYGEFQPNWIPPYLDFIDPDQGEVAVDSRYAAIFSDDPMPAMAVGRLPVDSLTELDAVIAKLLAYDRDPSATWLRRALFVSDNSPDPAGDFDAVIARLIDHLPSGLLRQHLSLTTTCGPPSIQPSICALTATRTLTQTWSAGIALLTYSGHGAVHRWAHEPLLTNQQLASLQPSPGLPFVISLDCLDGYFMMPPGYPGLHNPRSLAEIALTLPERGAIAYFAPSGLGTTDDELQIALAMYDALFRQGEQRLGPITQAGRRASDTHLAQTYTLFGDPAMTLALHPYALHHPLLLH